MLLYAKSTALTFRETSKDHNSIYFMMARVGIQCPHAFSKFMLHNERRGNGREQEQKKGGGGFSD